jgi:hypothetical protein
MDIEIDAELAAEFAALARPGESLDETVSRLLQDAVSGGITSTIMEAV